ncbi:hypothetical protein ACLKA7_004939 [Drosophila subpalustris]
MILRMQKQADPATEQLHTALKAVLTDKAAIKSVHDTVTIEVLNIDETTPADEVLSALFASFEGDIPVETTNRQTRPPTIRTGYKTNTLDLEILLSSMRGFTLYGSANNSADMLVEAITGACDASMVKTRKGGNPHRPVAWWNDDIAKARRECHAARRLSQLRRSSADFESLTRIYREKRRCFKNADKRSKARHFQELCDAADALPFGLAYKMVMGKLARQPMPSDATQDTSRQHHNRLADSLGQCYKWKMDPQTNQQPDNLAISTSRAGEFLPSSAANGARVL